MNIEVAADHQEAEEFVDYLIQMGYNASVGSTDGNFVNGVETLTNREAGEEMMNLWLDYCES